MNTAGVPINVLTFAKYKDTLDWVQTYQRISRSVSTPDLYRKYLVMYHHLAGHYHLHILRMQKSDMVNTIFVNTDLLMSK